MTEEITAPVETEVEEQIGEDYNEETPSAPEEGTEINESGELPEETVKEKKQRTQEEAIALAEEFYGVNKEDVVIDKNGNLRIVMKINGKKRLVDPQKDMLKGFNLNQAGYEKLNEGKQLVKQVQGFFDDAKQDPGKIWEMADKLGIDKYELAQQLLQGKVDEYSLTDEEKRYKELERREAELKKKEEDETAKTQTAQAEQAKQAEMQKYDSELTVAMTELGFQKASKAQKSHILMGAIGELMVANRANQELSCRDAVMRAKSKWQDYVHGVFDDIDDDHIVKVIPQKIIDAIRKADLKKIDIGIPTSNSQSDLDQQVELPDYDETQKSRKKVSMNDYFSKLTG